MKKETEHRVIIISFDAVGKRDLAFLKTLPNFGKFMEHAAICRNVSSVYPTLTYPAHTSIVTGKKPMHHGIVNNTQLQPNRPTPDWFWQRKYVKGTTLYDEAIKAGWKTAALLWPVTAKSRIRYCIPEVLANRPWQTQVSVMLTNSSPGYLMDMYKRFGHMVDGVRQPALDNFTHASALYTIRKHNPDLMLIHLTDVDTNRHIYGVEHEKVVQALIRHDKRLGEIMQALEETGDMSKTTVVLLGDHFQLDTHTIVYFNYMLKEKGYLSTKGDKITDYKVIAKNCDGSCYIYVHPKYREDEALLSEVTQMFTTLSPDEIYGIERIFSGKEAGKLGADDNCVIMIEAKKGYYYLDEFEVLTRPVKEEKKHKMRATHGYLPDKPDYKTFFMATGYGIQEHAEVEAMQLYDEGPTLAKLMGLELPDIDGRIVEEILCN
ncbi:MAG: alkaline phosphatase family protein [Lachnospiraceae bacterium]|nr:alkaline phosphatase family protein [Lachnospiraceae bacterium]